MDCTPPLPCQTVSRGLDKCIRAQEEQEFAGGELGASIAPAAVAEILQPLDHLSAWRQLPRGAGGAVRAAIVDNDQLVAFAQLGDQRRQRALDRLARVVGHDHDRKDSRGGPGGAFSLQLAHGDR